MKLRDILNKRVNPFNNQISFDVRKRLLRKQEMNIDDILNMEIKKDKMVFD